MVSRCPTTSLLTLTHSEKSVEKSSEYYYSRFKSTALSLIPMSNRLYLLQIKIKRNKKKEEEEVGAEETKKSTQYRGVFL